ncbi:MAG: acyl-CoA thioesterase II [Hyphomonadaceae bacterium]|nr:acyl-CoA thioesterase II [Hyphomonadaceae bacterium]
MSPMQQLLDVLTLEQIETNLFRGRSYPEERGRIFGGQVIAQALLAAHTTVEARHCHSLQAYFIRPGDPTIPVLYEVERSRDGKSFTTRRVIAIQRGEQILNLAASFQTEEPGFEHQGGMPDVPGPDGLPDMRELWRDIARREPKLAMAAERERPIEIRPIDPIDPLDPKPGTAFQRVWMRASEPVEGAVLNKALLAYASDMSLLGTSLRPHGVSFVKGVQAASLDHILWFHRPVEMHEWHLYDQDSPNAAGARGFNRGALFRRDGTLVASVAQEGLIRPRP